MTSLDLRDRDRTFAALAGESFELLVIGGGITGAGIARDAALRGLRVALVDGADFAAGTSSRSSKLVHGGLRYLAQGDLAVVREAARERRILRRIAPHLAQTLPMLLPARSAAALAKLRAGLWTYEKLGQVEAAERHEVWDLARLRREEPALRSDDLAGAVVYPEYLTDDARLTVANVRGAVGAGAVAVNHAAVRSLSVENGQVVGAEVADTLPGAERRARVRAAVVVNAAGPWVDAVRRLEEPAAASRLQLTEGIHLVLPRTRVPLERTLIVGAADKRSLFLVPRGEVVYLGTTDTFYPRAEYWPEIATSDVHYLLESARTRLAVDVGAEDVVGAWSGVRPLLAQEGKAPSEISRRDEVLDGPGGVLTIAGGKLTAYRRMAERVVDRCEERLRGATTPATTDRLPLPGGDFDDFDGLARELETSGVEAGEARRLATLYGSEARAVARLVRERGSTPAAEAEWAVLHEGALQLEDWWVRRSARAFFDLDGGEAALEPAAAQMAELLGWSAVVREAQVAACRGRRERELAVLRSEVGAT